MIVRWCTNEPQCGGNLCPRAFEQRGKQTAGLTIKVEPGRRDEDALRLFIRDLAMAAITDDGGTPRLAPDDATYEVHTVYDQQGARYWVALYTGEVPLAELLCSALPYDVEAAVMRTAALLAAHDEERKSVRSVQRRRW